MQIDLPIVIVINQIADLQIARISLHTCSTIINNEVYARHIKLERLVFFFLKKKSSSIKKDYLFKNFIFIRNKKRKCVLAIYL